MSARSVQIIDKDRNTAEVDSLTGHLVVIDSVHRRIHEGNMYHADKLTLSVANDASVEILVKVGVGEVSHVAASAKVGGDAELQIFEGLTVTGDGTSLLAQNRNRTSINTSALGIFHTPNVTPLGAALNNILVPGGSGGNSAGGDMESFAEWILNASENYLVRLTNRSGIAQNMGLELDWYEPGAT